MNETAKVLKSKKYPLRDINLTNENVNVNV